jgi:hypothetical protein
MQAAADSSGSDVMKQPARWAADVAALGVQLPTEQQVLGVLDMQLSLFQAVQQHVQTAERPQLLVLLAASVESSVRELSVLREIWEAAHGISRHERLQSASPAVTLTAQQAATAAECVRAAAQATYNVTATLVPHLLACRVAVGGPAAAGTGRGSSVGSAVACVLGSEYVAAAAPAAALTAAVEVGVMMQLLYRYIQYHLQMLGPGSGCASFKANQPAVTSSGSSANSSRATAATANSSNSRSQVAVSVEQQQEQLWQHLHEQQYVTRDDVTTASSILGNAQVGDAWHCSRQCLLGIHVAGPAVDKGRLRNDDSHYNRHARSKFLI